MKLSQDFFNKHPLFERDATAERLLTDAESSKIHAFKTKDGRLTVDNLSNLSLIAWHFHLDNEDFETIASFDVETIEDAQTILNIYKYHI